MPDGSNVYGSKCEEFEGIGTVKGVESCNIRLKMLKVDDSHKSSPTIVRQVLQIRW